MPRPQRKAAAAAKERMQLIFEWEQASESSKLFRDCAAAIDAEFEREHKTKRVKLEEVDDEYECDNVSDGDAAEEPTQEDLDFIENDGYSVQDSEWLPVSRRSQAAGAVQAPSPGSPEACTRVPPGERPRAEDRELAEGGAESGAESGADSSAESGAESGADSSAEDEAVTTPEGSDAGDSDAEDSDAEDSAAEDSDAEDSDAEDSAAEDSAAEDSDAEDSDA
ncbi:MAG: hypothetical protein EBR09_16290, partial [Proteobacteria bacterium]|nr:hypothetical protein [Pseudomonadota bacterium]